MWTTAGPSRDTRRVKSGSLSVAASRVGAGEATVGAAALAGGGDGCLAGALCCVHAVTRAAAPIKKLRSNAVRMWRP
jgi:hypothetical protein